MFAKGCRLEQDQISLRWGKVGSYGGRWATAKQKANGDSQEKSMCMVSDSEQRLPSEFSLLQRQYTISGVLCEGEKERPAPLLGAGFSKRKDGAD